MDKNVVVHLAVFVGVLLAFIEYEDHLKEGRYLLVVNGSLEDLKTADAVLTNIENAGLHLHTEMAA